MNYEQYHQKGGFYVIPVEIFDGLCEEKDELQKENQKLKDEIYKSNAVADTNIELAEKYYKEIERLKRLLKYDYEDNQEIMADIIKEKQELISYLKEQINNCKLKGCNYEKTYICGKESSYKEILSKIEKSDK